MSTQLRLRRGTHAEHATFTGAEGELTFVTDDKALRIHDGGTVGGHHVGDGLRDAPADGTVYVRQDASWVALPDRAPKVTVLDEGVSLASSLATLDFVGEGVTVRDDGSGHVTVTVDAAASSAATASLTSYDNSASELAGSDVQAAVDELAVRTSAPIVAVVAGADTEPEVRLATDYVEATENVETVIARALADGYRAFLLVGTCTASAAIDIDTADEVHIAAAAGASLVGDLVVSLAGAPVRLDAPITGAITDAHGRIERPAMGRGVAKIVALTQADYDALASSDPATLYVITDAA